MQPFYILLPVGTQSQHSPAQLVTGAGAQRKEGRDLESNNAASSESAHSRRSGCESQMKRKAEKVSFHWQSHGQQCVSLASFLSTLAVPEQQCCQRPATSGAEVDKICSGLSDSLSSLPQSRRNCLTSCKFLIRFTPCSYAFAGFVKHAGLPLYGRVLVLAFLIISCILQRNWECV